MTRRAAATLSVVTFAAGVGVGVLGYRYLGPRPPHSQREQSSTSGLYTDDEVRRVIERWKANEPGDELLRVVPSGTAAPLVTTFAALGFDSDRLGKPDTSGFNAVIFLQWQVSPNYYLSCMTATNDPENEGVEYTDPKRRLYGIRLGKLGE